MPHEDQYARARAELALRQLAMPARAAIIRYLREHPASNRGSIVAGTGLPDTMIGHALPALRSAQIITSDPAEPRRGQDVRYTVDEAVVDTLLTELQENLGRV